MAKYIIINRGNGIFTSVRSVLETGSENALTDHEEIINELYKANQLINKKYSRARSAYLAQFGTRMLIDRDDRIYLKGHPDSWISREIKLKLAWLHLMRDIKILFRKHLTQTK